MKTTLATFGVVFLVLSMTVCNGAEKIEGAFGLKLGAILTPTKPAVTIAGYQGYEFSPETPNPAFSSYLVAVSPTSHLIYKIIAISAGSDKEFTQQVERVRAVVSRKYEDSPTYGVHISQGQRTVTVKAYSSGTTDQYRLAISYDDLLLESKAHDESNKIRREKLAQDVDATGL